MCEHAGMLNHLFAKIDDLRIAEGDVVAQTAPQCFDIFERFERVGWLLIRNYNDDIGASFAEAFGTDDP